MKLRCPRCGFGKSVPKRSLPAKPRFKALCPKCGERFSVDLQGNKNTSYLDVKGLLSKKNSAISIIILLILVALGSFYIGQSFHTEQVAQLNTEPPLATPSVEKPVEAKQQAREEPFVVTLLCAGEEKMIDFSPSTAETAEDRWEAGPWPFSETYQLTLGEKGPRIELFLEDRDKFSELACRGAGESCSEQYETSAVEVKYNMELGLDKNFYARKLMINRTNGSFNHSVTMTGGSLRNMRTKTGTCKVLETGATSF